MHVHDCSSDLAFHMQESDATNREIKELQKRNNELQRLVDTLRNDCEELEEKHVIQTQKLREEMRALHNKHKQEAASLDTSHKVNVIWYMGAYFNRSIFILIGFQSPLIAC